MQQQATFKSNLVRVMACGILLQEVPTYTGIAHVRRKHEGPVYHGHSIAAPASMSGSQYRFGRVRDRLASVRAEFEQSADRWERETRNLSSSTKKFSHPDFSKIVRLGTFARSLVIERLRQRKGSHWFMVLEAIEATSPAEHVQPGRIDLVNRSWLAWADDRDD